MTESMRSRWGRAGAPLALEPSVLSALIQPAFPNQVVVNSTPAVGGLANTNIRLDLSAHPAPVLLRLYTRERASFESEAPFEKEAALLRLLAPRVPVPRMFFATSENAITGHPYMLREWVAGERLEVMAHQLDPTDLVEVAHDVGSVLAGIHSVTFTEWGRLDGSLNVSAFPSSIGGGMLESLEYWLGERGKERLGPELLRMLMEFAERTNHYGSTWSSAPSLTHADFGGSNILVNGVRVTAVVDWEFAFSGAPFMDFGNLLRPPLGELPGFEDAVARGYRAAGGVLPDDWRKRSLHIDLSAWAGFLGRPEINDALANDARMVIARTIDRWDTV